jgi:hypothetical protein
MALARSGAGFDVALGAEVRLNTFSVWAGRHGFPGLTETGRCAAVRLIRAERSSAAVSRDAVARPTSRSF